MTITQNTRDDNPTIGIDMKHHFGIDDLIHVFRVFRVVLFAIANK